MTRGYPTLGTSLSSYYIDPAFNLILSPGLHKALFGSLTGFCSVVVIGTIPIAFRAPDEHWEVPDGFIAFSNNFWKGYFFILVL